jgi:hypothetical protein
MFRESLPKQQASIFDALWLMPAKMQERLLTSWAHTFRQEVFTRIPEKLFASLFSEIDSRPNAPINIIMGGEILKSGFGWTDEELVDHLEFDLLTRHALGLDEVGEEAPHIRTFYNLRRRVREYAEENGQNLYSDVFTSITDEQLTKFALKTNWQRMDSTQMLSNVARMSRLELVIATLQKGVRALPATVKKEWEEEQEAYLSKPAQNICYRLKNEAVETHLQAVGEALVKLLSQLEDNQADPAVIEIVRRVISDQYQLEENESISLKPATEIKATSVQSPHDPEATYRHKHEQGYQGYVVNLSETCDPANNVQLITSVQTAANCVDDGQLLADTLDDLAERQVAIDEATVDGGYNGRTSEAACQRHGVRLRPTTIRGGQTKEGVFGWEVYDWTLDKEGKPVTVTCPEGQTTSVQPGQKEGRYLARFDETICAGCPFFQAECRVRTRRRGPTLNVTWRSIQVAGLRQGMSADNAAVRANVESTVHAFKHPYASGKLRVRGLVRAHMMACGSALMVNLRRLHDYLQPDPSNESAQQASWADSSLVLPLKFLFRRILSNFLASLPDFQAAPTSNSLAAADHFLPALGHR